MRSPLLLLSLVVGLLSVPALAFEGKPKLGPNAVPITQRTAYLRSAPAPDYWALGPFYVAQQTSSDGRERDHGGELPARPFPNSSR